MPGGPDNSFDPETLLASAQTLGQIEAVCRRRFPDGNEADECYIYVLDGLRDDDCRRLRSFQGRASLKTYIYTLINSLASDFKRHKYGRKRIPKMVSRLGQWAEAVYRFVCWQKYSYQEAYEMVSLEGLFEGSFSQFLKRVNPLKEAPCRENPRFVSVDDDEARAPDLADPQANPLEQLLTKLDHQRRLTAARIIRETTAQLPEIDQLLVKLVYGSDLSVAAAGRSAGLSVSATRKRLKGILIRFRAGLLAEGIRQA
ncbi:MAG: sigma-70 family RNA polymerase sigma factor [Deltaproteobacteria bacterium]|nr:sigma-70 family RNA polymerase sigma factor [Deltaproteobacteria bacterium]